MDRKERRRRARERKKLEETLKKEAPRSNKTGQDSPTRKELPSDQDSPTLLKRVLKILGKGKVLWTLFLSVLAVLGGYSRLKPHVSLEPYIPLNPVDPYSTQFTVKNENPMFAVYSMDCVCWPRIMNSGNNFSIISPGPLKNVHHAIPLLNPGLSSTIDCPPVIGGIGTYSGQVAYAELEIEISYRQSWWPGAQNERYPFAAVTDAQKTVHWVHITPDQERSLIPPR